MGAKPLIPLLFYAVAAYDGLAGAVFLIVPGRVFAWYGTAPPSHMGYVQFPALLIVLFAVMFVQIGRDPVPNRNLIPYGIGLKGAYCTVVFRYWHSAGIPGMWKPFAVIDAVTAIVFLWAYVELGKTRVAGGIRGEG